MAVKTAGGRTEAPGIGEWLEARSMKRAVEKAGLDCDYSQLAKGIACARHASSARAGTDFLAGKALSGDEAAISALKALAAAGIARREHGNCFSRPACLGTIHAGAVLGACARRAAERGEQAFVESYEKFVSVPASDALVEAFRRGFVQESGLAAGCLLDAGRADGQVAREFFAAAAENGWFASMPSMARITAGAGSLDALREASLAVREIIRGAGLGAEAHARAMEAHEILGRERDAAFARKMRLIEDGACIERSAAPKKPGQGRALARPH
jgi:hypothetical protein